MAIYPRHRVSSIYLATGLGHVSIYFGTRRQNTIQATNAVSHNATRNLIDFSYSIERLAMRTAHSRPETGDLDMTTEAARNNREQVRNARARGLG